MLNTNTLVVTIVAVFFIVTLTFFDAGGDSDQTFAVVSDNANLRCPISNNNTKVNDEIRGYDIRWTKLPKRAFIAALHEDGNRSYIVNGKYTIKDSSRTSLVIQNTTESDAGEYICRVRIRPSFHKTAHVTLFVSEPFNIELEVSGSVDGKGDNDPLIVNRTIGSTLKANCSAIFTTPYGILNLKWTTNETVHSNQRIREDNLNVTLGDGHAAFSELTLVNISLADSGLHTCQAFYEDQRASNFKKAFYLEVQTAGTESTPFAAKWIVVVGGICVIPFVIGCVGLLIWKLMKSGQGDNKNSTDNIDEGTREEQTKLRPLAVGRSIKIERL